MDSQFPMFGDTVSPCGRLTWSRVGIGSGGKTAGGRGIWVSMRPSVFLALATPLPAPRDSLVWLHAQVAAGEPLCPPVLDAWFGQSRTVAAVGRHDGRHRTTLALGLLHDAPIPVLLRLQGNFADGSAGAIAARVRPGMLSQKATKLVPGPLFGEEVSEDDGLFRSGAPPPRRSRTLKKFAGSLEPLCPRRVRSREKAL
jgi:hypothetical protein